MIVFARTVKIMNNGFYGSFSIIQFLKEENIQKCYVEKLNELFANEPDTENIEQLNIDI